MGSHSVQVRRVYDRRRRGDGYRVLVDRLWPRGVGKDDGLFDEWCKAAAPSSPLRKWYAHDPERFEEFGRRYREELHGGEGAVAVEHLRTINSRRNLTLLTATRVLEYSGATVLAEVLRS